MILTVSQDLVNFTFQQLQHEVLEYCDFLVDKSLGDLHYIHKSVMLFVQITDDGFDWYLLFFYPLFIEFVADIFFASMLNYLPVVRHKYVTHINTHTHTHTHTHTRTYGLLRKHLSLSLSLLILCLALPSLPLSLLTLQLDLSEMSLDILPPADEFPLPLHTSVSECDIS